MEGPTRWPQGATMTQLSKEAQNLNWLVNNFVRNVRGDAHAIVVSSDGLLMAVSDRLDRARADQLSAVASGLASLTQGAARVFDAGVVNQTIVEMERGFLFVMSVSDGSCLAVLASPSCDIGLVGYEMALLVARTGDVLTPQLRAELQAALPQCRGLTGPRDEHGGSPGLGPEHPSGSPGSALYGNRRAHAPHVRRFGAGDAGVDDLAGRDVPEPEPGVAFDRAAVPGYPVDR